MAVTSDERSADEAPAVHGQPEELTPLQRLRLPLVLLGLMVLLYIVAVLSPVNEDRILFDALRSAVGVEAAVYALAAIGLNIHFGYTGLLNFGHVGFMLVGAFGLAVTVATFGAGYWLGIVMGLLAASILGLIIGVPTLRLRADYLAIVTIAVAEILRFTFRSGPATGVTGGVFGLTGIARQFYAVNPIPTGEYGFWLFNYSHRRVWILLVAWGLVLVCSILVLLLARSPWGRVLKSIRDDEDAARSLGKNVFAYKMQSLVLGGAIGGLAGMVWVTHMQTAHPDTFLPIVTFYIYALLILGGPATVIGPVIGSIAFWFLLSGMDSFLRQASGTGMIPPDLFTTEGIGAVRFLMVGLGLVLLMVYRPEGMFGSKREMQLDVQ